MAWLGAHTATGSQASDVARTRSTTGFAARSACSADGPILATLLRQRGLITFAPPRPFNPDGGIYPSEGQLRAALRRLWAEGFRVIATYGLERSLGSVPRIAKRIGFRVVAGIYWYNDDSVDGEIATARRQKAHIDAVIVGSEGLLGGRYTRGELLATLNRVRSEVGVPVSTSEPEGVLLEHANRSVLRAVDWVAPDIQPLFAAQTSPRSAALYVARRYRTLRAASGGKPVIVREAWWPTGKQVPAATQRGQVQFFRALAATGIPTFFGEAYDQPWKRDVGGLSRPLGPDWGWHDSFGQPKLVIGALRSVVTSCRGGAT